MGKPGCPGSTATRRGRRGGCGGGGTCRAALPARPGQGCRPCSPRLFSTSFPPARGSEVAVPVAAPMATAGRRPSPPAISRLLFPHPCEAASAQGLPQSTSACAGVLLPMACSTHSPLSVTTAATIIRHSTRGSGQRHHGPWDEVVLGPVEDTLPCASNLPFPEGVDVRCHAQKCSPGL